MAARGAVSGLSRRAGRALLSSSSQPQPAAGAAPVDAGQPTHLTHPQRLSAGETTFGVTAAEYKARRDALASMMPAGGVAVLAAANPLHLPSTVIPVPAYRQEADLLWLTGVNQAGVAAAVRNLGAGKSELTLFVQPPDPHDEVWNGPRLGAAEAAAHFGADEVAPVAKLAETVGAMASGREGAACWDHGREGGPAARRALEAAGQGVSLQRLVQRLRWRKSPAERELMRAAAAAGGAAMEACAAAAVPGAMEYEAGAAFEYVSKQRGASRLAYPSVVAGGPRANYIHYSRMDASLRGDELLLVDAGCEVEGYVCDITRTWPVGGTYSGPQREVYEVVLEAHRECMAACRGGSSLRALHALSVDVLCRGLGRLMGRSKESLMAGGAYRAYYPHSVGHWLGMDTHDCATVGHDAPLVGGVVLTLEPGLYLPVDDPAVPQKYRGIGVRVEDDVLVGDDGAPEVLSHHTPVCPDEAETWAAGLRERGVGAAMAAAAQAA
mmetsp:Transcript_18865/g.64245  ORF Transcript_18865/g.64245 Transcript_18865/m.64245 type:complete len:496 (-) Transcript_18865:801-2288(-)